MPKWTIIGESRTTAAKIIISALTERGLASSCDLAWLRDRLENHDWIPSDDVRLGELAALAGLRLQLRPLPDDDDDD